MSFIDVSGSVVLLKDQVMLVFDDEFLLTVGGKVDLFILPVGLSSPHPSNWVTI